MSKSTYYIIGGVGCVFLLYFTFVIWIVSMSLRQGSPSSNNFVVDYESIMKNQNLTAFNPKAIPSWLEDAPGCPEIDIVYTWVNGSDPKHIQSRVDRVGHASDSGRYRDLDQLRYSLRSIETFAKDYVRHIYLVTDNQIPSWLNTAHPRISVIPHSTIFKNRGTKSKNFLPTFNSNSIELNLHHIPGLAECFVYLNDDMFFGRKSIPDEDFFDSKTNQQLLYFGGWEAPKPEEKLNNIWKMAVRNTNSLMDSAFGPAASPRHFYVHGVYFYKKTYLKQLAHTFKEAYEVTFSHPTREKTDVTLPFLYGNFVKEQHPHRVEDSKLKYTKVVNEVDKLKKSLNRLKQVRPHWVCINDGLGDSPGPEAIKELTVFLQEYFPKQSEFELTPPEVVYVQEK